MKKKEPKYKCKIRADKNAIVIFSNADFLLKCIRDIEPLVSQQDETNIVKVKIKNKLTESDQTAQSAYTNFPIPFHAITKHQNVIIYASPENCRSFCQKYRRQILERLEQNQYLQAKDISCIVTIGNHSIVTVNLDTV